MLFQTVSFRIFLCVALSLALTGACDRPDAQATADSAGTFEIRIGERVSDWCQRMDQRGLKPGCAELQELAGSLELSDEALAFVPRPVAELRRFEGLFVPGQYELRSDESSAELVRRLLRRSAERLAQIRRSSTPYSIAGTGLSEYEQLTLASIVEKEAASNRGYERVAAVFLNRLRAREVLGSCPTVEYALGYHRPFLLFKDLEIQSPYNVYKRKGLPPTPIAFFSNGALQAVRQPIDSEDFFFVYDWTTGELVFAVEYSDHKRNAQVARKNFIRRFGDDGLYQKYDGLFYELPPESGAKAKADTR